MKFSLIIATVAAVNISSKESAEREPVEFAQREPVEFAQTML